MLVLSRKKNEQIVIQIDGQTVVVQVLDIARDRVRLGITAPQSISVHREEVARRLQTWHEAPTPVFAEAGSSL